MSRSIYDFRVATIDGDQKSLADYRGRTLLIVNTASRCGFTPQYASLEALYQRYKNRGFEILAFPANNFMGQEPGTNAEIKEFCSLKYRTSFPLFEKISVKGKDIAPLYAYLTRESGHPGGIPWNFAKFLGGRTGEWSRALIRPPIRSTKRSPNASSLCWQSDNIRGASASDPS